MKNKLVVQSIVIGFLLTGSLKMDPINLVYNLSPRTFIVNN
jgi:hypothetical protein